MDKRIYHCDRCGSRIAEFQCKVSCPNCGSRFDCSDLNINLDEQSADRKHDQDPTGE